ncbi:hypothetical protein [Streptomyces sp. NBC_01197]|nr:hypothetical protein OG452_25530 [Streptomyces sp. NBC_01197]
MICASCDQQIRPDEPSQEYEISGGTGVVAAVRLHVVCPVRVPPVRRYRP